MKIWISSIVPILLLTSVANATENSKLNLVLDISGSMSPYTNNIAESVLKIKLHASKHPGLTENISLFSFTDQFEFLVEGDSKDIISSIKTVKSGSGVEDGLIAIDKIVAEPLISNTHIILFTDEGRDVVKNIDLDELIRLAIEKNITIHSVLKTNSYCQSKKIIGVNRHFSGYSINRKWLNCSDSANIESLNKFIKNNNNDYIKLSLSTGGNVWSINSIFGHKKFSYINTSFKAVKLIKESDARNDIAIDSFSHFIASELINSYERDLFVKVKILGELTVGNIITIDASNVVTKEGVEPIELWEWDFNNDGYIDDYSSVINLELKEQGNKLITLWMTSQNQGKTIREKEEINLMVP